MITPQGIKKFTEVFKGSDKFYLANPQKITIKKNGGQRWGVIESSYEFPNLTLEDAIQKHLDGSLRRGVVLPPIRKSDNKCIWGAIDIDGNIYKDEKFKKEILQKIQNLNLPLTACYSKSKGLHLYIKFIDWTPAEKVIQILKNFLHKLNLPEDTEIFPKQSTLSEKGIGNGIMLPFMYGVGNNAIREFRDGEIEITNDVELFVSWFLSQGVNADEIKIDLPKPEPKKETKDISEEDNGYTKLEILNKIKDGTIEQHPSMGGRYHSWIQVVIAKAVKQRYGDNEILQLIKEVHQDGRKIGYTWPESYKKQIDYARRENRLNIPNPGETQFLKGQSFEKATKLEKLTKSYCYVMANDMFNKIGTPDFYQEKQINNFHKHEVFIQKGTLASKLLSSPRFAKAETFITSAKYKPGLIKITKPGEIPLIQSGTVLNIYIPNYLQPKEGDVKFIIDFFIWLIGEKKWKIIEQWIAFNIQYPGVKMKWAVVLVSVIEGVGKGLLARVISRILGYENVNENANYKHLTNTHNTLLIGTQVLVLNEVSLGDFKSKAEGSNTLKNFVADDFYSCNFKNKPMVKLPNLTNFMLFSNDERVLSVNDGSRRYLFNNIKKTEEEIIQKTDEGIYDKAWEFVDSDEGASALIYYFKNVDIPDPKMFLRRAPQTDDLKELIEQSKHPVIKKLEYDLTRPDYINRKIFTKEWSGLISFEELQDKLSTKKQMSDNFDWGSFGDDALYKFLSSNCIKWNNGDSTRQVSINGTRHRLYNLEDKSPIPGKSYKDLTPIQIETIYKKHSSISKDIEDERPSFNKAKESLPTFEDRIRKSIQELINEANQGSKFVSKKFKDKKQEEVFDQVVSGDIKLNGKTYEDQLNEYRKAVKIIKRGIRTPEQIVESYKDKDFQHNPRKISNY